MSPVPKKIERGDSLVSPGMVCYAEKQVKPFWFSSLDQIVQFDTIIFCRTFKNYFGQFVWIEKKKKRKVTIIVAFHFMKRRLKIYRRAIFSACISCTGKENISLSRGYCLPTCDSLILYSKVGFFHRIQPRKQNNF